MLDNFAVYPNINTHQMFIACLVSLYSYLKLTKKVQSIYLKVPRNPSNLAFICTQIGLIHDIFSFFVCKKHYFKK